MCDVIVQYVVLLTEVKYYLFNYQHYYQHRVTMHAQTQHQWLNYYLVVKI